MKNFTLSFYKGAIVFLFLFLHFYPLKADSTVDSLYHLVKNAPNDSIIGQQYIQLLDYVKYTQPTELVSFAERCLEWGKTISDTKYYQAIAHEYLGEAAHSQSQYDKALEHLEQALGFYQNAKKQEQYINVLIKMGDAYDYSGQYDQYEAKVYEAKQLADSLAFPKSLGVVYRALSNLVNNKGQEKEAIEHLDYAQKNSLQANDFHNYGACLLNKSRLILNRSPKEGEALLLEAISLAEKHHFKKMLIWANGSLAYLYQNTGELEKALKAAFSGLAAAESLKIKENITIMLRHLGNLHTYLADYENAKEYFQRSFDLAKETDDLYMQTMGLSGLGKIYRLINEPLKAIPYFKEAIALSNYYKNTMFIASELADCYLSLDSLETSRYYLNLGDSLDVEKKSNVTYMLKNLWALYYLKNGEFSKAIKFGQEAHQFALSIMDVRLQRSSARTLSKTYIKQKNYEKGYYYYHEYQTLEDSLKQDNHIKKITTLELNSKFEKEKEVLTLEQAQKEALLKAETKQTQIAAAGITLLAILGFVFLWNARRKNHIISQKNEQLEQANITKDRIFAIIGHDLRKPAINFRGVAKKVNYLLKNQEFETLNKLGIEIEKDALALNKLTDNLLSWALTQKNVMPYNPIALPLREVTDEVIDLFKQLAEEKGVKINNEISEDLEVFADLNSLQAIIRNLVDNGIKYSNHGGEINLTAVSTDKGVKIEVADTGIGMNEDNLKDIFLLKKGKNQQGTKGESGTGLGLHLVQELVKLNKGLISVKSQLGLGTNFEVVLPRVA